MCMYVCAKMTKKTWVILSFLKFQCVFSRVFHKLLSIKETASQLGDQQGGNCNVGRNTIFVYLVWAVAAHKGDVVGQRRNRKEALVKCLVDATASPQHSS